jgi:hypothetical protein
VPAAAPLPLTSSWPSTQSSHRFQAVAVSGSRRDSAWRCVTFVDYYTITVFSITLKIICDIRSNQIKLEPPESRTLTTSGVQQLH